MNDCVIQAKDLQLLMSRQSFPNPTMVRHATNLISAKLIGLEPERCQLVTVLKEGIKVFCFEFNAIFGRSCGV